MREFILGIKIDETISVNQVQKYSSQWLQMFLIQLGVTSRWWSLYALVLVLIRSRVSWS